MQNVTKRIEVVGKATGVNNLKKELEGVSIAQDKVAASGRRMTVEEQKIEAANLRLVASNQKLAVAQSRVNSLMAQGPQPLAAMAKANAQLATAEAQVVTASANKQAAVKRAAIATAASTAATKANTAAASAQASAMRGSSFQTANLAAQFNDIGVMMASGQNPLILALQQGTQISQVLNTMGGGVGVLRSLGAAALSIVNPVSLITIGLIAGGSALVQWGMSAFKASEDAEKLSTKLDAARESLTGLKDELRTITLGVTADELALLDAIQQQTVALAAAEANLANARGQSKRGGSNAVAAARDELNLLQSQLIDLRQIQAEKETLKQTTKETADNERLLGEQMNASAQEIAKSTKMAEMLRSGIKATTIDALELAGVDISNPILDAQDAARLLELGLSDSQIKALELAGISISGPISQAADEAERLANNLFLASRVGLRKTVSDEDLMFSQSVEASPNTRAKENFSRLLTQANKRASSASNKASKAAESAAKKAAKAAEAAAKIWTDAKSSIKEATADLRLQTAFIGDQLGLSRARKEIELLNAAKEAGKPITAGLRSEVETLANAYSDAERNMSLAEQAQKAFEDSVNFARDVTGGFISDLKSGLKSGEGFWNSFKNAASNALDKIADKLLNSVLDAIFQVNNASSGLGGGGGLFGSLLGGIGSLLGGSPTGLWAAGSPVTGLYANGTNSAVGGMSLVGERGPELVNLPRGSQVFTNPQTQRMLAGNNNQPQAANQPVNLSVTNTFDGETIRTVIRDEAGAIVAQNNAAMQKQMPKMVYAAQQSNKQRGRR